MIIELTEDLWWKDGINAKKGSHLKADWNIYKGCFVLESEGYEKLQVQESQCIEVKETPEIELDPNKDKRMIGDIEVEFAKRIEPDFENYDSHYSSDEIETINIQEQLILTNLPKEHHEQALRSFRIATAFKYISRCGKKDDTQKELTKAINYLTRARDGEWAK